MNTDKRVLTDKQRQRKNELSRLNRLKKKDNFVVPPDPEPDSVPEPDVASPEPEPMSSTEDLERKRKEATVDKFRKSLILSRSKITSKNQIRKEKDMEIDNTKKEAEEVKRKAHEDSATHQKIAPCLNNKTQNTL